MFFLFYGYWFIVDLELDHYQPVHINNRSKLHEKDNKLEDKLITAKKKNAFSKLKENNIFREHL